MRWASDSRVHSAVGFGLAVLAASILYDASAAAPDDRRPNQSSSAISPESPPGPDSLMAVRFLAGARGSSPLACQMIVRSLGVGYGWGGISDEPDAEIAVRDLVRWAVGRREDPAAVPPLRAALREADSCVSRVAARLLGETRHPRAIEVLLEALGDPEARVRRLGAIGLGHSDDRSAADALLGALEDEGAGVRAAAAWALGSIEARPAIPELSRLLARDPDATVRRAAALALGEILDD